MKTPIFSTLFFILLTTTSMMAQENNSYLFSYEGKNKTQYVRLFAELGGSYSQLNSEPAGYLGAKLGFNFNNKFSIGLTGKGLYFDKSLDRLISEGSYHLESAYAGLYLEYLIPFGDDFSLGLTLITGQGETLYRYDHEYRADLEWYQEIIDRDIYAVFEPGIEILMDLSEKWSAAAFASYRTTSPIKMRGTNQDIFEGVDAGISFRRYFH